MSPSALRLSISTDGTEHSSSLASLAATGEEAHAENIWLASHLFHREPIVSAMFVLSRTRDIGVVLMAMSPYVVHPVYATMAAATIEEFFPGRVQLCFGAGAPRDLEAVGMRADKPLETLRDSIEMSRSLLAGDTVRYHGERFAAAGRRLLSGSRPIPIWLAASGPQMLELAGEAADGVVISSGAAPAFIRWCLENVRRGESAVGRTIAKAGLVLCSVDADGARARNRLRKRLGYLLRGQHHARNLALAGTRLDQVALTRAYAAECWEEVEALITDELLAAHTVSGTPAEVRNSLVSFYDAGLDEIIISGTSAQDQLSSVLSVMRS